MNRRSLSSLLCISALGGQLLLAQTPDAAANSDALSQLRARIAEQQEQIKKLQQAVDQQQKMLDQTVATQKTSTPDGTAVIPTAAPVEPVKLVPAVNTVKPDIVNKPRYMQKDESNISPLSVNIGNSTFTPFGFIDVILYGRSTNTGSGIGSSFGSIPYNNSLLDHISEQNITLQNSRIGFRVDSTYKGAKVLGYLEMDFLGNQPTGIYQTSNSDVFRMRNVFVDVTKGKFEFLGGQDWSMFTSNRKGLSPIPSDIFYSQAVDTNYQAGLIWARQSQFRFVVHPNDNLAMGLSFENPQQFIGSAVTLPSLLATPLATQLNNGGTTYTAPNVMPDILFKVAADSKIFHIEAGAMVREFKIDTSTGGTGSPVIYTTHSATGGAGEVNGVMNLNNRFRLIANTYFGDGAGRYIGGNAPDLMVRPNGSISPIHSYSTTDGFEINPTKNSLLYAYYSALAIGKDYALDTTGKFIGFGAPGSSLTNNKTIQEGTIGFAPTFWKSNMYGSLGLNLQYSYVYRDPWAIPAAGPKEAHLNLYYINLRYTLP